MSRSCAIAPADVLPVLEMILRWVALAGALVACGRHAALHEDDGGGIAPIASRDAATPIELPAPALGMPDLASYAWRKRAGQPAFRTARKAEGREDWPNVVVACRQAIAADPGHLEASWLLAVALAKTGTSDDVLAPLAVAGAGDFGKWATASLEQPALQRWLATPIGEAWRRRVEQDREVYAAALARAVIVIADGDIFAFDATSKRFYRLTRTYGAVIAAVPAPSAHQLGYVVRRHHGELALGMVDLVTGHGTKPTSMLASRPIEIGYNAVEKPFGFWVGYSKIFPTAWFTISAMTISCTVSRANTRAPIRGSRFITQVRAPSSLCRPTSPPTGMTRSSRVRSGSARRIASSRRRARV